jgi:hypothetical protein
VTIYPSKNPRRLKEVASEQNSVVEEPEKPKRKRKEAKNGM